jgi:hypothetical protein
MSKKGKFTFTTSRPVTDSEGRELEALLLNYALTHGMKIGGYWYDVDNDSPPKASVKGMIDYCDGCCFEGRTIGGPHAACYDCENGSKFISVKEGT